MTHHLANTAIGVTTCGKKTSIKLEVRTIKPIKPAMLFMDNGADKIFCFLYKADEGYMRSDLLILHFPPSITIPKQILPIASLNLIYRLQTPWNKCLERETRKIHSGFCVTANKNISSTNVNSYSIMCENCVGDWMWIFMLF